MLLRHFINGNVIRGNLRLRHFLNPADTVQLGLNNFLSQQNKRNVFVSFTLNVVVTLSFAAPQAPFRQRKRRITAHPSLLDT